MDCPRCRGPFVEGQILGRGGAYRGAHVRVLRCEPCALSAMDVSAIAQRYGGASTRWSRTMLCRSRERADDACSACLRNLDRITLSWDTRYVELEECEACGLLYLDAGEIEAIGALVHASRPRELAPRAGAHGPDAQSPLWDAPAPELAAALRGLDALYERA